MPRSASACQAEAEHGFVAVKGAGGGPQGAPLGGAPSAFVPPAIVPLNELRNSNIGLPNGSSVIAPYCCPSMLAMRTMKEQSRWRAEAAQSAGSGCA